MYTRSIQRVKDLVIKQEGNMVARLARNGWVLAWRGMIAVLLGLAILVRLDITLAATGLLFGAFALTDGLLALIVSRLDRHKFDHGRVLLLREVAGIAIGLVALLWPSVTAQAMVYLIASWAILTGAFEAVAVLDLRSVAEGERKLAWGNAIEREMMRAR
jgi:uncharacterized membrane protein HdeD (DUF308 family)